jgi:hypothetical protein
MQDPWFARSPVLSVTRGLFDSGERDTEFSFKATHYLSPAQSLTARYAFSRADESARTCKPATTFWTLDPDQRQITFAIDADNFRIEPFARRPNDGTARRPFQHV